MGQAFSNKYTFLPIWTWEELEAALQALNAQPDRRREILAEVAILRQEAEGKSAAALLQSILVLGYSVADDRRLAEAESATL